MPIIAKLYPENTEFQGESQIVVAGLTNAIDLLTVTFAGSRPNNIVGGRRVGAAHPDLQEVGILKYLDSSSLGLLDACVRGQHIEKLVIVNTDTRTASDQTGVNEIVLKMVFEDCYVTAYNTGFSGGNPMPTETITFAYAKSTLSVNNTPVDPAADTSGVVTAGWDRLTNIAYTAADAAS